jgi:hypothetical protein
MHILYTYYSKLKCGGYICGTWHSVDYTYGNFAQLAVMDFTNTHGLGLRIVDESLQPWFFTQTTAQKSDMEHFTHTLERLTSGDFGSGYYWPNGGSGRGNVHRKGRRHGGSGPGNNRSAMVVHRTSKSWRNLKRF